MTMATSVELRVPLLDHHLLEFAASLHPNYKVQGTNTKRVLKAALSNVLPEEILARKKAGFPIPFASWLTSVFKQRAKEVLLDDSSTTRGYFQKRALERHLGKACYSQHESDQLFSLLILELWHQEFADAASTSTPIVRWPATKALDPHEPSTFSTRHWSTEP
jgi:asparagine synthase (glutamine-hydrolysing)